MKHLLAVLVTATAFFAGTANAATTFFDDFETETLGLGTTTLTNWDVVLPNVDVIGNGSSYDFYPGNGKYLDLDGTTGSTNSTIRTKDSFEGGSYTLTFLLGNNPGASAATNALQVRLGNNVKNIVLSDTLNTAYEVNISTFGGKLWFIQGGNQDQQGSIIDNVRLTRLNADTTGAVPEPTTVATILSGLGAIGLGRWRRSRKA